MEEYTSGAVGFENVSSRQYGSLTVAHVRVRRNHQDNHESV